MTMPTSNRDLEAISLEWEKQTLYDSIDTIKRVYTQSPSRAYQCVWPGCKVARKDAAVLWRHVHTGHGPSTLPPAADRDASPPAEQEQR